MMSEELRKIRADNQERMALGMQLAASKTQSFGSIAERIQFNLIEQRLVGKTGKLLDHIEEQAGQIAALKAACIHSEAKGMMLQHNEWSREIRDLDSFVEDAKRQLAQEHPNIFWEEME